MSVPHLAAFRLRGEILQALFDLRIEKIRFRSGVIAVRSSVVVTRDVVVALKGEVSFESGSLESRAA